MIRIPAVAAANRKEPSASSAVEAGTQRQDARAASTVGAGGNSRSDEWMTPPEMIEAIGPFDLDPACSVDMPWRTASVMWTAKDDGLSRAWPADARVFCNPPYSRALVAAFMKRVAEHNFGTALVNARTDTVWFTRYVWQVAAALLFVYQRIKFIPASRELTRDHARGAAVLVAYGTYDADRLADSGIEGAFVPLPGSRQIVAVFRPDADGVTWVQLLERVARRQGGRLKVSLAYVLVKHHPKAAANPNFQAKVRQVLQGPSFRRVAPATYELRASA